MSLLLGLPYMVQRQDALKWSERCRRVNSMQWQVCHLIKCSVKAAHDKVAGCVQLEQTREKADTGQDNQRENKQACYHFTYSKFNVTMSELEVGSYAIRSLHDLILK